MNFWNERNLEKLSELFTRKYEEATDSEWASFLKTNECEILPVDTVHDTCRLVNLREDLSDFVLVACDNDCEVILVPKDFAAAAVVLGEMPCF